MLQSKKGESIFSNKMLLLFAIIFPGLCWYISGGLNGDYWWLMWVAPVPVLLVAFKAPARVVFFVSFIAYLVGRLSWFGYLVTVATLVPAIIFTIALPLVFALIMLLTRLTIINSRSWYAVFAFPVFFTAFEWLLIRFSADGTAASIAYSQLNFLPLIQLASVTGILGITFMVTFIPSFLAFTWRYRREKRALLPLTLVSLSMIAAVFVFGFLRIYNSAEAGTVKAGLVVLDEDTHKMGSHPDFKNELEHTSNYAKEIAGLAKQGAALVVLPERALNINREYDSATMGILSKVAKENHVAVFTGYTNFKNEKERNSALVIDSAGNVVLDYNKMHLVTGLEDQFTPGNTAGLFRINGMDAGVAICKDLDFPGDIIKYGKGHAAIVCIPAWDFVTDDWLHSRMAVLRGVENGFSEVRVARQGRLTISDAYGRMCAEASAANGAATMLTGQVPLENVQTFYTSYGNWFGIIVLGSALLLIVVTLVKHRKNKEAGV